MNDGKGAGDEHVRRLMMAALDGEISDEDRRELDTILDRDPGMREEWTRMRQLKQVTDGLTFREPPPEVWERYWGDVYNRAERGVAWILVSVGAVVVAGYGMWHWFASIWADTQLPIYLRLAIFALSIGGIILGISVLREKLFTRRHDAYKEIQR